MAKQANQQQNVVSFEDDELILVDENDEALGFENKQLCHNGVGILHRAFSLFIFNENKELLLQQRSAQKHLWPLYWSNSCCSHPRRHEPMEEAIHRRLQQELGLSSKLQFIYKFQYQAAFEDIGTEKELCWVYVGMSSEKVCANIHEIAAWRYINLEQLQSELKEHPDQFTPWFKMEWDCLNTTYSDQLDVLINR